MPNEAYKRRLEEWEEKERQRKASMETPPTYDLGQMRSRIPMGCALAMITAFMLAAWLVWRYFKLHA